MPEVTLKGSTYLAGETNKSKGPNLDANDNDYFDFYSKGEFKINYITLNNVY